MGPTLIFDKSAIECLTVNESVWLDAFFLPNIVPTFYIEALADLEKKTKNGKIPRAAEDIVREVVRKTPVMETCPNVHYMQLVIGDLLGQKVEVSDKHRPIISGGEYRRHSDGTIGISFDEFPESAALDRWKTGDFLEVERKAASEWRQLISNINVDEQIKLAESEVPTGKKLSSIEDVRDLAIEKTSTGYNQLIYSALTLLNVPPRYHQRIKKRWRQTRYQPFNEFAPYAAHVMSVNLFFYLCVSRSFLALAHKGKNTNLVDLSYLYYLPFCSIFTSCDSLHKRIVPLFMGEEQSFIDGHELKGDFATLDEHYRQLPQAVKDTGTMPFAAYPPTEIESLVASLYDKHLGSWREAAKKHQANLLKPRKHDRKLLKHLNDKKDNARPYQGPPLHSDQVDSMMLTKRVPVQRGDWRMLPVGIENKSPNKK